jgi:hypothetical protein
MPLCDQTDIEALLQSTIVSDPNEWIPKLIQLAQGNIEREVGTTLDEAYIEETLDGPIYDSSLWLSHWPVTTIATLTEDGTALVSGTDFFLVGSGRKGEVVRLISGYRGLWTTKPQAIVVGYTAGYQTVADVPNGLRALCAQVTARAFQAGATFAEIDTLGLQQLKIGDYQESYDFVGLRSVSLAAELTDTEKTQARSYGRPALAIR